MVDKVPMGRVVATPGALAVLEDAGQDAGELLARHNSGDWGEVPREDARENDLSVRRGYRILSSYRVGQSKVWIITEADRSSTCLLLPEDY
jgi:hypothetical protein